MKKLIPILLILSLMLFFGVYAEESFDFRNTRWGMSQEEVLKSEKLKIENQSDEYIYYMTTISNKKCILVYYFTNNKLYRTAYLFQIDHTNDNDYITDYNELKKLAISKYGQPITDDIIYKNNLYKNNPEFAGLAVGMGYLVYRAIWENDQTKIMLGLTGDNFEISLGLIYESKTITEDNSEQQEEDLSSI